jgi:hypothetical protein
MTQPIAGPVAAGQAGRTRNAPGPRSSRRRRNPQQPGLGRWGSLQGGLGVCIIVISAAIGAIATMVMRTAPGAVLGFVIVIGTITAALAVRPRAGRLIFPVPVLSYLVAALLSGVVYNRSAGSSKTALAISTAQWIANGFFAMALATILAIALTTVRWYLWRRNRATSGRRATAAGPAGRPVPAAAPGARRPRTDRDSFPEAGYPVGSADPASPGDGAGTGGWAEPGTGPRPGPRAGSGPYNFSSGA